MSGFIAGAVILIALVLALLLRPLLRRNPGESSPARAQINASIYRNQLAELEIDLANGIIDPAACAQARRELERRALEDTQDEQPAASPPARWPAVALILLIPAAAALTYVALGTPVAMLDMKEQHTQTVERIHQMVADLAQRLEREPGDLRGWAMLGRAYKTMDRLPEAIQAFERAGTALDEDPQILVDFAEALALADKDNFQKQGVQLIERALKIDPNHLPALVFAGSAAFDRADYRIAIRYWQKVLAHLPPDSDEARAVAEGVSRANEAMAQGKSAGKLASGKAAAKDTQKSGLRGVVAIAPALAAKAGAEDTVFVFARAAEGPRAPLAVLKVKVKDLPLKFLLDDSLAMSSELRLSRFDKVRVEARISRSGNAAPQSGDMQGASGIVNANAVDLRIVIDQLLP